jgi:hypothetical protein
MPLPIKALLDTCPPEYQLTLQCELCAVKADAAMGISAPRTSSTITTWDIWAAFCQELCQDAYLTTTDDPIPLLQVFA